jgi:hypothetical protein
MRERDREGEIGSLVRKTEEKNRNF